MNRFQGVALAGVVWLTGCAGFLPWWPASRCQDDRDCRAGFRCAANQCVEDTGGSSSSGGSGSASTGSGGASSGTGSSGASGASSSSGPASLDPVQRTLAVGTEHVCGVRIGPDTALCTGNPSDGRLGVTEGTRGQVADTWMNLAAGRAHTCGVNASGELWCWGSNEAGQAGQPLTVFITPPEQVDPGSNDWVKVSAFWDHTCGIRSNGGLACWGNNEQGQVNATEAERVYVDDGPAWNGFPVLVRDVAVGRTHSCAVALNGQLYCWGSSDHGALGLVLSPDGGAVEPVRMQRGPAQLLPGNPRQWRAVCVGTEHSCAVDVSGQLACWGIGGYVGRESGENANEPVDVDSASPVLSLACGGDHTCFTTTDNRLFCFGAGDQGQLGLGTLRDERLPQQVPGAWTEVTAGGATTCALDLAGTPHCWGQNQWGQVNDKPSLNRIPTRVPLEGNVVGTRNLVAGARHVCALLDTGSVSCWGDNRTAQSDPRPDGGVLTTRPTSVAGVGSAQKVGAGATQSCFANTVEDASVTCWGDNALGQLGAQDAPGAPVTHRLQVADQDPFVLADGYSCLRVAGGETLCAGQLPGGPASTVLTPLALPDAGITHLAAGGYGLFALAAPDATVWQLQADAGWMDRIGLPAATTMCVGRSHMCMFSMDIPLCYAALGSPAVFNGTDLGGYQQARVSIGRGAHSACCGADHTCLVADGGVFCWGANGAGQVGAEGPADAYPAPVPVAERSDAGPWEQVACGDEFTCGVRGQGEVWCWGNLAWGQAGDGLSNLQVRPTPWMHAR